MSDDLLRCPGTECPLRATCQRARLRAYGRYDSFGSPPFDRARGACEHYLSIDALAPTEASIRDAAYRRWERAGRPDGTALRDWHASRAELEAAYLARLTDEPR